MALAAGEGEGGVACLGMDWGIFQVFSCRNFYFTVLLHDFILECKGRTGYLVGTGSGMVGTGGGW